MLLPRVMMLLDARRHDRRLHHRVNGPTADWRGSHGRAGLVLCTLVIVHGVSFNGACPIRCWLSTGRPVGAVRSCTRRHLTSLGTLSPIRLRCSPVAVAAVHMLLWQLAVRRRSDTRGRTRISRGAGDPLLTEPVVQRADGWLGHRTKACRRASTAMRGAERGAKRTGPLGEPTISGLCAGSRGLVGPRR